MSATDFVHKWGLATPNAPAIALGDRTVWDYRAFSRRIAKLAGGLAAAGISSGSRIGLVMSNHPDYLTCLCACWHLAAAAVPINAKLHPEEIRFIVEHAEVQLIFVTEDVATHLPADLRIPVHVVGSRPFEHLCQAEAAPLRAHQPDDLAWIFYTSGTTGRPKGAMLSHRNLMMMSYCYAVDIDPDPPWSAILHPAPLSHGSGMYALPYFMKGGCQVIPESGKFDSEELFALTDHWAGCSFFAAPTMIRRLTQASSGHAMPGLKAIIYGGAPMLTEDIRTYLDRFGPRLAQLYGQGEAPMTITGLSRAYYAQHEHADWPDWLASAGLPLSGVDVRTVDEAGDPVPTGEVGEIITRSDCVMRGYWNNDDATKSALRDGWLWTGDMGMLDESGFLTLKDRSKDVIISGGSNIYPREVEEILLTHPSVAEVAVIGYPDGDWGEIVMACVVTTGDQVPEAEMDQLCQHHIARFKRPKRYEFLDSLPKNNYGKIVKRALRDQFSKESDH